MTTYNVNVDSNGSMSTNPPVNNVTTDKITCKTNDVINFTLTADGYYFTQGAWPLFFRQNTGDYFDEQKPDTANTKTATVTVTGSVTHATCKFYFQSPSLGQHDPSIVIDNK